MEFFQDDKSGRSHEECKEECNLVQVNTKNTIRDGGSTAQ